MRDHRIGRFAQEQRSRELRCRRRGLDAEATLPRAPEELRNPRVEPVNRQPVGSKGAQPRPTAFDALDWPVDDSLKTVDRDGDVDFLGSRVAGRGRNFIVRAEPDRAVAFTLEIKPTAG